VRGSKGGDEVVFVVVATIAQMLLLLLSSSLPFFLSRCLLPSPQRKKEGVEEVRRCVREALFEEEDAFFSRSVENRRLFSVL
jgi:hypothetical protein